MKQECRLSSVWTTWAIVPASALVIGVLRDWPTALFITIVAILGQMAYVRVFPHISAMLGYGSVDDVKTHPAGADTDVPRVTLYTARGCPFCPIIRTRLLQLQQAQHFELEERDATFRPQLLTARGIRSVPAIEAGGRFLVGNATTDELVAFLTAPVAQQV